jgi:hypothetical protein
LGRHTMVAIGDGLRPAGNGRWGAVALAGTVPETPKTKTKTKRIIGVRAAIAISRRTA